MKTAIFGTMVAVAGFVAFFGAAHETMGGTCPVLPATQASSEASVGTAGVPGSGFGGQINNMQSGFGSVSATGVDVNGNSQKALGTTAGGADPSASASSSGSLQNGGVATVTYFMEACGAPGSVALFVSTSITASAMNNDSFSLVDADASEVIYPALPPGSTQIPDYLRALNDVACVSTINCSTGSPASLANQVVDIPANTLIEIDLGVSEVSKNGAASGSVDPTIELDSKAPNASAYTLAFSSGITAGASGTSPVTTAPEPSALGLIAFGCLGLIGLSLKKQSSIKPN
jgi:hypothetical protein